VTENLCPTLKPSESISVAGSRSRRQERCLRSGRGGCRRWKRIAPAERWLLNDSRIIWGGRGTFRRKRQTNRTSRPLAVCPECAQMNDLSSWTGGSQPSILRALAT